MEGVEATLGLASEIPMDALGAAGLAPPREKEGAGLGGPVASTRTKGAVEGVGFGPPREMTMGGREASCSAWEGPEEGGA